MAISLLPVVFPDALLPSAAILNIAFLLNFFNLLRISETTEIAGKDVMSLRNHYFQEKDIQNAEKAIVKAQITNENE